MLGALLRSATIRFEPYPILRRQAPSPDAGTAGSGRVRCQAARGARGRRPGRGVVSGSIVWRRASVPIRMREERSGADQDQRDTMFSGPRRSRHRARPCARGREGSVAVVQDPADQDHERDHRHHVGEQRAGAHEAAPDEALVEEQRSTDPGDELQGDGTESVDRAEAQAAPEALEVGEEEAEVLKPMKVSIGR